MGIHNKSASPANSEDENGGGAFTDGDFGDSDDEVDDRSARSRLSGSVVADSINANRERTASDRRSVTANGRPNRGRDGANGESAADARRDSREQNPSILGVLGNQHDYAEQRLALRRAARAEAREIRMRELERQQRESDDHADRAFDMHAESNTAGVRRGAGRLRALSPGLPSPRRSSDDSAEDLYTLKDLRHELKEGEEKFRKAMILNAQLDNDKAALAYQLEALKDRADDLQEDYAQLQREHKEKCSAYERVRRELACVERELSAARWAVRARDAAAAAAGFAFVDAAPAVSPDVSPAPAADGETNGVEAPTLALVSRESQQLLDEAGEGTLDVRLQKLLGAKQSLESEVRKLKLQLNDERTARQNGVAHHADPDYESEVESLRRSVGEARARAARAEAEACALRAGGERLEAQLARLKARARDQDDLEEKLQAERRRLVRETREALNRVEELETENSHLIKRLDKLKNAKSALLKEL